MHAFEPVLEVERPDLVLVYGDTNTPLAGALSSARRAVPLAHVEAGMRSFDWSMPEERNRVLADHVSDLGLCATPVAVGNLEREGLGHTARLVGDVMADVSLAMAPVAERRSHVLEQLALDPGHYLVLTAHRAGNVDHDEPLAKLVELLHRLPSPTVFPVHPRTRAALDRAGALGELEALAHLRLVPPLGYLDFMK